MTLEQLIAARSKLLDARLSGVREFRDQNGETVRYATDSEMARALASIDAEINRLTGRPVSTIKFSTSKGL